MLPRRLRVAHPQQPGELELLPHHGDLTVAHLVGVAAAAAELARAQRQRLAAVERTVRGGVGVLLVRGLAAGDAEDAHELLRRLA